MKNKIIFLIPRVLCILAILFISMFAMDAFDPKLSLKDQILGFLVHLIPSFVLIILLVVAWKWELIGGIIFLLVALLLTPGIFMKNYHMNHSFWISLEVIAMITFPFVVVGGLFIWSHFLHKKKSTVIQIP